MNLTNEDIAAYIVETVNKFREPLEDTGNREVLWVGQCTLISDVTSRIAKDETPRKAVDMLMGQMAMLFEDYPGLKAQVLADQLKMFAAKRK